MTIKEFLGKVIETGKAGATEQYSKRTDANGKAMLEGALAGFEACRNKEPAEILKLLEEERAKTRDHRVHFGSHVKAPEHEETRSYWRQRLRELQVEWVANCISAALVNSGLPGIVPVTARGFMHAASILGVKKAFPAAQ